MRKISFALGWILFFMLLFTGISQAIEVKNEAELREAILSIQNATGPVVIEITKSIVLSSELPAIGKEGIAVTITGGEGIKISGNDKFRGFFIDAGDAETTVAISGIQLNNCVANGGDGGSGAAGGGGGAGLGGAIFVKSGNIVLEDVKFRDNQAVGGSGGTVLEGSSAFGGGGGLGGDGGGGTAGDGVHAGGGGGGLGVGAVGGNAVTKETYNENKNSINGGNGIAVSTEGETSGIGFTQAVQGAAAPVGTPATNGGGGGGSFSADKNTYAAGGGGGIATDGLENDAHLAPMPGTLVGGNGGYGGGGGGSTEIAGDGGFGGGGGAGGEKFGIYGSGSGGYGGGGGGNANSALIGYGGLGAGDGGYTENGGTGGGGLGAGGALFVSEGASVTIKSTSSSEAFKNNSSSGGQGGGGTAGNGEAIGNAIFLAGNVIFDTAGHANTIAENIDSQVAASNYSLLGTSASESLSITGGGSLLLRGVNTYAGATKILDGMLVVQGGEAIGDDSAVWISEDGILSLRDNETIGALSGAEGGVVQLYWTSETDPDNPIKYGGKTLTISGDADLNPADSFSGRIVTDGNSSTRERLVKSGSGTLTLAWDNSNEGDEFLTEIQGGTIRLENSKGLGGGNVTISVTAGSSTQNAIEAGIDGLVMGNDLKINSGAEMRVGAADSSVETFGLSGTISGSGSLVLDMENRDQVLLLSNTANSYGVTYLETGTLAVVGEKKNGTWTSSLGTGKVVAVKGGSAALQGNTDGMVISNIIQVEADSLRFTNDPDVDYEISGAIQGKGGIEVYLNEADDVLTLSGKNTYGGLTVVNRGTLRLGAAEIAFNGGLSLLEEGKLDLAGNALLLADNNDSMLAGSILDSSGGDGSLSKTGTGTLDLDLQTRLGLLSVSSGTTRLLNEDSVAKLAMKGDAVLQLFETDATVENLSGTSKTKLEIGENTLTIRGDDTQVFDGTIHGSGTIIMEQEPGAEDKLIWGLSGDNSESWTGRMVVREGTKLVSGSANSLGKAVDEDGGDVASVSLEGGTLATYASTNLGRLDVSNGTGTLDTTYGTTLNLYDITGSEGFTKTNLGTLVLNGGNENYSGTTTFKQGFIYLMDGSTLGSGTLVSAGASDTSRLLAFDVPEFEENGTGGNVVFANDIDLQTTLHVGLYGNLEGSVVFSGDITGEGGLVKTAGGVLALTGSNNTYSGTTQILSGILQLGDAENKTGSDLLNSDVIVSNGAVLKGVGNIKSLTVESGGIVLPGFSPGVLNVIGDMTLEAGSGYGIVLDLNDNAGSGLVVDGKATVNGGVLFLDTSGTEIETGSLYTFITAGELEVKNSLFITDDIQNVRAVSVVDGESGSYGFEFVEFDYEREGQDATLGKLGVYLNDIADNSYYSESTSRYLLELNEILNNDGAAGDRMMREMLGEIHDTVVDAKLHSMTNINQLIASQLRPSNAVGYTNGTVRGQSKYNLGGRAAWFAGFGTTGSVDPNGGASGYDYTNYGGIAAIEIYSAEAMHFGGYYSYGNSEFDTDGSIGKSTVDDHLGGAYLKWNGSMGYWIASAAYGLSKYETNRKAGTDNIYADYDGWQIPLYLEKGFNFGDKCNMIQPYLGVQYVYLKQDAITEHGSELNALQIGSRNENSLRSILGARATMSQGSVHHPFQLSVHGAWIHEYFDIDGLTDIRSAGIAGATGFDVKGSRIGKDWFSGGIGAEWHFSNNWSLFGAYEYQFNNRMELHNGNLGLRIIW